MKVEGRSSVGCDHFHGFGLLLVVLSSQYIIAKGKLIVVFHNSASSAVGKGSWVSELFATCGSRKVASEIVIVAILRQLQVHRFDAYGQLEMWRRQTQSAVLGHCVVRTNVA